MPAKKKAGKRATKRKEVTPQRVRVETRQTEAVSLYVLGLTQNEIAKKLGVAQKSVSRYIEAARQEFREQRAQGIETLRTAQLQRLEAVIRTAWIAYEASGHPEKITEEVSSLGKDDGQPNTTTKGKRTPKPKRRVERVRTLQRTRVGDPRYLEQIQKAIKEQNEILGLRGAGRRGVGDDDDTPGSASLPDEIDPTTLGPEDVILVPRIAGVNDEWPPA